MPLKDLDTVQKKAAASPGAEIAVTAGAGSGKTRLLVGRYLFLLKSSSVSMQEIAAITFTEKAAGQMKAAIARKAASLAEDSPSDAVYWRRIAGSVHEAPISTIHAFCNAILRRYPREAGIDPQFAIIDDTSCSELMREALDSHIRERLDNAPEALGELIYAFGFSRLKSLLLSMLKKRSVFTVYLDDHNDESVLELEQRYCDFIVNRLDDYCERLEQFHSIAPAEDSLTPALLEMTGLVSNLKTACQGGNPDSALIAEIAGIIKDNNRKGSPKKWGGDTLKEMRRGLGGVRDFVLALDRYYRCEKGKTAHLSILLLDEFRLLESRFLAMKKELSCLDHDDSLIETWRLLRHNAAVLGELSSSYRHILIDEFQDTDPVQVDILRMIAGNSAASLFTVGDPKQSIYRFRGADIEAFNRFVAAPGVDFHALKTNYRSSSAIIAFVNRFFGQVMGREHVSDYDAHYSDMKPAANGYEEGTGVDIVVFESDGDTRLQAEARYIADMIESLRGRFSYSYSDMAVIVRKGKNTGIYAGTFLSRGIPYVNMTSGDPGSMPSVLDCGHLLSWIANPYDLYFFNGLLLSPFFSVSPETLYGLRVVVGETGAVPEAFIDREGIAEHPWFEREGLSEVRRIMRLLLGMRDRASIRDILERAFDETDYTLTVLADPVMGELSLSVLDKLCETADVFERSGGSLEDFARLLIDGVIADELAPSVEPPGEAVSILTIHKSKGLEYKVVFLADVTARMKPGSDLVGIHPELGLGFAIRESRFETAESFVKSVINDIEARKSIAESKRLFYVGCTRAERHLFILGGEPSDKSDTFFENQNWIGWIHAAFSIDSAGGCADSEDAGLFRYTRIPAEETRSGDQDTGLETPPVAAGAEEIAAAFAATVPAVLPAFPSGSKPEHLSPSQLLDYIECPSLYYVRHVASLPTGNPEEAVGGGYGERYGSFAHRVLERVPIVCPKTGVPKGTETESQSAGVDLLSFSRPEINRLVENLAGSEISLSWRKKLEDALYVFVSGGLYREIVSAESVRREVPFGFALDDVFIRGAIDLLYSSGEDAAIVDFKTDARPQLNSGRHSERYRLQVGIYGLAVERALYLTPSRLIIHYLTSGETDTTPCSRGFLGDIAKMLSDAIASIAAGDFSPRRSDACRRCLYYDICRRLNPSV